MMYGSSDMVCDGQMDGKTNGWKKWHIEVLGDSPPQKKLQKKKKKKFLEISSFYTSVPKFKIR